MAVKLYTESVPGVRVRVHSLEKGGLEQLASEAKGQGPGAGLAAFAEKVKQGCLFE